ncbi:Nudix family hydrolase [Teredinibacter turnerae]|uniref:Nudix family hydrolase n=1 Tax=Teredinibacter turnerae TaxID=2426 RepID=UPI001E5A19DF|nr:Nudix family hydrolase [Teredinibacter turnerae]
MNTSPSMPNIAPKVIHVAVGVVRNAEGEVLIAKRQTGQHLAGFWEFPGGKVEQGECVTTALARELREELGIEVSEAQPLVTIPYDYPEKRVLLDVHEVTQYSGLPVSGEGQSIRWVAQSDLGDYTFPPANAPIVTAVQLPAVFCISGEFESFAALRNRCRSLQSQGITHIQLRAPHLEPAEYLHVYRRLAGELEGVSLFANTDWRHPDVSHVEQTPRYIHMSGRVLRAGYKPKPAAGGIISAACHDVDELKLAENAGAHFVFFSPVKPTLSHPQTPGVGWEALRDFCAVATVPVYALGGLSELDISQARQCGAQGIAAVSALWGRNQ